MHSLSPWALLAGVGIAMAAVPCGAAAGSRPFTWSNPLPFRYAEGQSEPRTEEQASGSLAGRSRMARKT